MPLFGALVLCLESGVHAPAGKITDELQVVPRCEEQHAHRKSDRPVAAEKSVLPDIARQRGIEAWAADRANDIVDEHCGVPGENDARDHLSLLALVAARRLSRHRSTGSDHADQVGESGLTGAGSVRVEDQHRHWPSERRPSDDREHPRKPGRPSTLRRERKIYDELEQLFGGALRVIARRLGDKSVERRARHEEGGRGVVPSSVEHCAVRSERCVLDDPIERAEHWPSLAREDFLDHPRRRVCRNNV